MSPKVAVIGCGHWGKNLVRNFNEIGALAAISDFSSEIASEYSDQYGIPALSYQTILEDPAIDAVVISTPAIAHADLAIEALRSGKDVFCEKPLAITMQDAETVIRLARQSNRILMVGHLLQYHPAFLTLKELVANGNIGALQYIYSNRLNLGKVRREENILWSFAPHDISMILALVDEEPSIVSAVGSSYLHSEIADVTITHLDFPGGVRGHVFVSWLHPYKEQKLVVVGKIGMAVFDDGQPWESKLVIYPHNVKTEGGHTELLKAAGSPVPIEPEEPLQNECRHFLDCIATRNEPRTNGEEALRVLRVLNEAGKFL